MTLTTQLGDQQPGVSSADMAGKEMMCINVCRDRKGDMMLEMVSGQVWGLQAWENKYSGENRHSEGRLGLLWGTPWPTRRASAASMFLGKIRLNYPSLPDLGQPSVRLGWEGVATLNSSWGSPAGVTRATEYLAAVQIPRPHLTPTNSTFCGWGPGIFADKLSRWFGCRSEIEKSRSLEGIRGGPGSGEVKPAQLCAQMGHH